jgi:AcrR family transcriptional regulator
LVTETGTTLEALEPGLLPPSREMSEARRRMFETAIVLFGERGFHGVSVRDLTNALGQHKAALYGHAASKQDLLFQLVLSGYQEHLRLLKGALAAADDDPVSQVRALMRAHVQFHLYYRAAARVCTREFRALTDENRETVSAVREQTQSMLLNVVQHGKSEGVFTVDDVELAVLAIAGMGIRIAEWQNLPTRDPEQVVATYEEFALQILGAS